MTSKKNLKTARTYDSDGYVRRAAAVCLTAMGTKEEKILLVSSNLYPDKWIIPGGGIEVDEIPVDAAVREAYEEAGVRSNVARYLGVVDDLRRRERTCVFLLQDISLLNSWPERENPGRRRRWFDITEAKRHLEEYKHVQLKYLDLTPCCT